MRVMVKERNKDRGRDRNRDRRSKLREDDTEGEERETERQKEGKRNRQTNLVNLKKGHSEILLFYLIVRHPVIVEVGTCSKSLATHTTLVWFFSTVYTTVSIEGR